VIHRSLLQLYDPLLVTHVSVTKLTGCRVQTAVRTAVGDLQSSSVQFVRCEHGLIDPRDRTVLCRRSLTITVINYSAAVERRSSEVLST